MKKMPKDALIARLREVKVPCGPINTIRDALGSEQAQARDAVIAMQAQDVENGQVQLLGNPLKFSATPVQYRRPPPRFGQDTDEVFETWGLNDLDPEG